MATQTPSVRAYLASLPDDRRELVEALRGLIRKNLDPAFEEGVGAMGLGYHLPHSRYPAGYHCDPSQPLPFASIASQKRHVALYFFGLYCVPEEARALREAWKASGKRLDVGASCIRIKKLADVPLDVVGAAVKRLTAKRFVEAYEAAFAGRGSARRKKA